MQVRWSPARHHVSRKVLHRPADPAPDSDIPEGRVPESGSSWSPSTVPVACRIMRFEVSRSW